MRNGVQRLLDDMEVKDVEEVNDFKPDMIKTLKTEIKEREGLSSGRDEKVIRVTEFVIEALERNTIAYENQVVVLEEALEDIEYGFEGSEIDEELIRSLFKEHGLEVVE